MDTSRPLPGRQFRRGDLPYVFGGDGATMLIPPTDRTRVGRALLGVMAVARASFSMELHAGMIRIGDLRRAGRRILYTIRIWMQQFLLLLFIRMKWTVARRIRHGRSRPQTSAGKVNVKRAPWPGPSLSRSTTASSNAASLRATARPIPKPPVLRVK